MELSQHFKGPSVENNYLQLLAVACSKQIHRTCEGATLPSPFDVTISDLDSPTISSTLIFP